LPALATYINYDNVAEQIVWKTVHEALPALQKVVEEELKT